MRPSPRRWSSFRCALVAAVVGVLLFSGAPLGAWSAPTLTPTPTPTPSSTDKIEAQDESTPKAKDADESPSPSPESTGDEKSTPADDESASEEPADDSSESAEPEESESTADEESDEPSESASPSKSASPSATPSGRVTAQLVPPATGNNAVITVKVGGNRSSLTSVGNLAGVTLGFYDTPTGTTPAFTCVSDADGDCSVIVPNTQVGGVNRDRRFYVRQIATAPGYYTNPSLGTSSSSGAAVAATTYQFQTGTQLRSGTVYSSTSDFMIGTGNSANTASGGIWQNSRNDPTFPAKCGINVALVLDLSNSVTDSQLVQLKAAANGFVDALTGTASSVGTFTFATSAPATAGDTLALTSVSTTAGATTVKNKINSYNKPGGNAGGTNWDRGIYQVAQSSASFDVAVIITDGNPTFYGNGEGPGTNTRFREVENGIFSANAVKAEGTKVIAFGVGDGVDNAGSGQNLRSISGPVLNSDYYQTNDYAAAGEALRALALGNCTGSITVVKQVVPSSAPPGSTAGAVPAGGWTFTATGSSGITVDPPTSRVTATGTGAANFPLTFAGGTTSGPVTLTETLQAGYTLQQVAGSNAVCTRVDTGAAVPVTNSGALGFTATAASTYPISCTVYNRAPNPAASVVLNKTWIVNGTTYAEGSQPPGLTASGLINGTDQPWGTPRTGFSQGDSVTLNESLGNLPAQCTLVSSRLTSANGSTVNLGLPANQTLAGGANSYGITNTLTCQTRLSLDKTVRFGTASPSSWTLTAIAPLGGALPGPTGTTGVTGLVTPGVTYTLREDGGDPAYVQLTDPNAVLRPNSTGSMFCVEVAADGTTVIPGFADGLNGGVTVPFGSWVRCRAINETASLRLVKEVINDNGGTAVPSDWNLTATPTGTFPSGLPTQTRPGATFADAEVFNVRPGVAYSLSESSLPGYANTNIQCQTVSPRSETQSISLRPGDIGTCFFVNNDQPATLTLIKDVENGTSGSEATPADWTLTATPQNIPGQAVVSGNGDNTSAGGVNQVEVFAGSYALSESTVPGYTAGNWTCTGGTQDGSTVAVPNGGNVTCRITNTAQPVTLTLVKEVVPGISGVITPATAWNLTADGPVTISGATGSTAVTGAAVEVGTYDLSETDIPGWENSAWVCEGAASSTAETVTLALGNNATCTITNTAVAPRLTLVKEVENNYGGQAEPEDWTLTAAGQTTTISGITDAPEVTNVAVPVGDYNLSETGPGGYTADDGWDCGDADQAGSVVTLPLGADVTCTIINRDQPGQLTLIKQVDNGTTGADGAPEDWTLTATPHDIPGQPVVSGNGDPDSADGVNEVEVFAGSYALSESTVPGYTAGNWTCTGGTQDGSTVAVPNGGNVTCTIVNTAQPVSLTLVKLVEPGASGDTTPATAWTLTAAGPVTISGATESDPVTDAPVQVGTYDLSESTIPGWEPSDWVCTGATSSTDNTVTLALGDDATCTITNEAVAPRLTLVKEVENNYGGQLGPEDWTLTADGPTPISGVGGSDAIDNQTVQVGDYELSESGPVPGYEASTWDCGDAELNGNVVTLPLGANVTCTIINSDQPAYLTLVKVVSDEVPTSHVPADWTLTADPQDIEGQDPVSGNGDPDSDGGVNEVEVFAGSYELSEDGPAGFEGSIWECTGGTVDGNVVTIPNDGNVTCTITNTAIAPHLTLVKQIDDPNDYGTAQPTDWTLSANGPSPISGATGDASVTDASVQVGGYDLSESGPANYTASDWTCEQTEGGAPVTVTDGSVTLAEGDDVTCTIVNTPVPPSWSIAKLSDPPSGATVDPGEEITYGVFLIRNEGVDPRNVVVNDDLSQVLNNATLVDGPTTCGDADCTVDYGTASITGNTLTWNVPVLDQPIAYVQYTVRVNDDAYGVTLENHATSPGSSPCVPQDAGDLASQRLAADALATGAAALSTDAVSAQAEDDELCPDHTDHYTPAWSLDKTSDPESGSEVDPGDQVTYTLTVTNTTDNAVVDDAVVTDDLSDVLQYATLDSVPSGATLSGDTLAWNVPELQPGESAELTYTVTVDDDAYDVEFGNVATPGDGGTCTNECQTDHYTPPKPGEPSTHLPNTGGTSLVPLGLGFGFLLAGGLVLNEHRRRQLSKVKVKSDPRR